ncbi:YqaJ viral recombinase family protein [Endozoicomonas sp. SCSIO W0465]|uniref:YqaJ viral recombinase family protein n=1 Tax=Endozoicomonas sp. SCSIO W0465 TaxID=2918516 RepID=UPI0020760E1C|nr:YqaJ viral recombinase family protein [Endozoicomonas sp. SCSIO W0465]USE36911.1 YqaJ viral recombinase family protein [Endozoicomonas sp. SCSIO W0465]
MIKSQALRREHFTASEAPAMMGDSPFTSRDQLIYQKVTGFTPVVTPQQQRRFDQGHAAEAAARPIIEEQEMKTLFPVTGICNVEGLPLLASFDGLDLDRKLIFEHKLWNQKVVAQIEGEGIEPAYYWQLEQQLLVSGQQEARAIFVCSDGTRENLRWVYYESHDYRRQELIEGWQQFQADLKQAKALHEQGKLPNPYAEAVVRHDDTFQKAEQSYHLALQTLNAARAQAEKAKQDLIDLTGGAKTKGSQFQLYPTYRKGNVKWQDAFKAMLPKVPMKDLEQFKGKPSTVWTVKPLN